MLKLENIDYKGWYVMGITLMFLLTFLASYFFFLGVYQFIYIHILYKGYLSEKLENESFLDFCIRYFDKTVRWKFRKKITFLRRFYNGKGFRIFTRLKGVFLVLISLLIVILILYIKSTDYSVFLDMPI